MAPATGLEGRAADRLRAFFRLKERGFCGVFFAVLVTLLCHSGLR